MRTKLNLKTMQTHAKNKGGKCLSDVYINSKTPLKWQCEKKHEWLASPSNVLYSKSWCAICAGLRADIEDLRLIAKQKGGTLLSKKYTNSRTKLLFQCVNGHKWEARPTQIRRGHWCLICSGSVKGTIEQMQEIAHERGGVCLSSEYINRKTKLTFRCSEGHEWQSTPDSIKRGSWCSICSSGLGERLVRVTFEQLFKVGFPKSKPNWLGGLELDGFNQKLGLAFEHQGEYHFGRDSRFFQTLQEVKRRDNRKKGLCAENNVKVILIPEIQNRLPLHELKNFIKKACREQGIRIPKGFDSIVVNYKEAYAPDRLRVMRAVADKSGGKLLSLAYLGSKAKYEWECQKGHIFYATSNHVCDRGTWCPYCAGTRRLTIGQLQKVAKDKGGRLLSLTYSKNSKKLEWICKENHKWLASAMHVRAGSWCPTCSVLKRSASRRLGLDYIQSVAKEREGLCLSTTYRNSQELLKWQCHKGHKWFANFSNVKGRGSWCPTCANQKAKLTIEQLQKNAKARGGSLRSLIYITNKKKLEWSCHRGHIWFASAMQIRAGDWCPTCANRRKGNVC